jgi:hypothetical protein
MLLFLLLLIDVETELRIDGEICVRRVQRTQTNVTRSLATYTELTELTELTLPSESESLPLLTTTAAVLCDDAPVRRRLLSRAFSIAAVTLITLPN